MAVIGIDLGGTKVAGAIFDNDKIIQKEISSIDKRKGKEVGELICNNINNLLAFSLNKKIAITGIGISVPGIYYANNGRVWAPNISEWEDYPLLDEIKALVKDKPINVRIDSDRACYILGEVWKGNAAGLSNAIFMAVGTGIGAGILIDNKILRGANDIAGAIGWLALDRPYFDKYKNFGCYEYHASGDGIARVAKEYLAEDKEYKGILSNKNIDEITSHDIFDAYKQNDTIAVKTIKLAIEFWGMAAANLVSLFNPEVIIFGGGVFGPAVEFINEIYEESKKWAQPISITKVKFLSAKIGSEAGLYGAGYLALEK